MVLLERLLNDLETKVRRGDFASLASLAPQIEAALAELSLSSPLGDLARLKAKADFNARLLDAARRGVKAARRRLDDARLVTSGLQTYDGSGKRSDIALGAATTGRF